MGKIRRVFCILGLSGAAATIVWKVWNSYILQVEKVIKFRSYFNILDKWLKFKEQGQTVETYFVDNQLKSIGIYGMGKMARHLMEELKENDTVKILYGIDRMANVMDGEFPIYAIDEKLPKVDAIVVTVASEFDEIREALEKKNDCLIISLDDVIGMI